MTPEGRLSEIRAFLAAHPGVGAIAREDVEWLLAALGAADDANERWRQMYATMERYRTEQVERVATLDKENEQLREALDLVARIAADGAHNSVGTRFDPVPTFNRIATVADRARFALYDKAPE